MVLAAVRGAGPAWAHTEVLRAEPAPAVDTSEPVDSVELTFLDPVLPDVTISVTDDAGAPVAGLGETEQSADRRIATVGFEPLREPGGYVVEYSFTAEDGDRQTETYRFTYRAGQVATAQGPSADDGGGTGAGPLAAGAVAVTLLAATAVALRRRRS